MTYVNLTDIYTFKRVNTRVFEVFEILRKNTAYFNGCEYLRCEIHDDYVNMYFTVYSEDSTNESFEAVPLEYLFKDEEYIVSNFTSSKE